jgi:predicted dehydrogenase
MKLLIAGYGSIGRRHFQNLISLGEEDLIFFRTHQSTLDEQELAGFTVETELDAALDHQPDGVIIANPTAYHLDVAIPAARKGCHILIEKPLSNTLEEMDQLEHALKESGSRLLVGFQFRFHPGLLLIKEWLHQEIIGQVHYVRAHWGEYLPDWHPWEDYQQGYSARKDLGGGVLLTLSHPIDYLSWMFGRVNSVSGTFSPGGVLGIDVEECLDATLRFENGPIGGLHLNYLQRPPEHKLEIIGSEGTIVWNDDGDLRLFRVSSNSWENHKLPVGYTRNDMFLSEMKHFLEVIKGEDPFCTLHEGLQVQQIIQAIYQSAETGKEVKVQS